MLGRRQSWHEGAGMNPVGVCVCVCVLPYRTAPTVLHHAVVDAGCQEHLVEGRQQTYLSLKTKTVNAMRPPSATPAINVYLFVPGGAEQLKQETLLSRNE